MGRKVFGAVVVAFLLFVAVGLYLTRPSAGGAQEQPSTASPPPAPEPEARVARLSFDAGVKAPPPKDASLGAAQTTPEPRAAPPGSSPANVPNDAQSLERAADTAVKPGDEAPRGTVDKEAIRAAIKSVTPLIKECFTDAMERYPPPQKVVLKFTIVGQGISGHFNDGEIVESTIVDPWVQACFLDSLKDARFPAPHEGGEVTVTYPFSFSANAPPDAGVR